MEKFMTKAQRKREVGLDPEQEKFVSSNYNRHKILSDIEPFTEDILQGEARPSTTLPHFPARPSAM